MTDIACGLPDLTGVDLEQIPDLPEVLRLALDELDDEQQVAAFTNYI